MAAQTYSEKARKYLSLLDEARCNDRWAEVPELARKVGKHAPDRHCLVYTARIESDTASRSSSFPPTATLSEANLTGLRSAVENEASNEEDVFQARATLALALLESDDKEGALAVLPTQFPSAPTGDSKRRLQGWTYVSAVKAAYIREVCSKAPDRAGSRHHDILTVAQTTPSNIRGSSEYRAWLEKLLFRLCLVKSRFAPAITSNTNSVDVERILAPFRVWYDHWEGRNQVTTRATQAKTDGGPVQRDICRVYYLTLSELLRIGYVYPASAISKDQNPQSAQISELRKVEDAYESFLLKEVPFPEASSTNKEVDDWADLVMENWSLTCGLDWRDEDLGPGGREAASKHVLDILYRAATRTFHSCSILRHLFAVHASVADFELAGKALESYLEIVLKGKARVEKSGLPEPGLDSDEAMLQTISYGIDMHCSYGKIEGAICAEELSRNLQDWLERHEKSASDLPNPTGQSPEETVESTVPWGIIASLHQAIAISKANWARFTLDPSERSTLQNLAIKHLRQSLIADPSNQDDPKTLFALALVLAETRDTEGAIATIKFALAAHSQLASDIGQDDLNMKDRQKRTLAKMAVIQCWHLLALLLSSRHEFDKAEAACEAALESFEDHGPGGQEDIMKQLSFFEKQQIVEVKLTQSLLLEVNGGAELSINAGGEALRLYAHLFNTSAKAPGSQEPPKTANGPLKHVRSSIFSRRKPGDGASTRLSTAPVSVYSNRISEDTTRPPTMVGAPDNASLAPPGTARSQLRSSPSQKLQKRPSRKSVTRGRVSSPARPTTAGTTTVPPTPTQVNGSDSIEHKATNGVDAGSTDGSANNTDQADAATPTQVQETTSKADEKAVVEAAWKPRSHASPYAPSSPRFSASIQEQYTLGLLSKIWSFISALYRRAGLFDDARGAIEEAFKLANKAELSASALVSNAKQYERPGWGGGKSVDEIWADIHAESAQLSVSEGSPREAMSKFETALSYFPEHQTATVGLSNLLLDIYSQILPPPATTIADVAQKPDDSCGDLESSHPVLSKIKPLNPPHEPPRRTISSSETFASLTVSESAVMEDDADAAAEAAESPSAPKDLDRLAARDRAFGMLSSLTKLGTSWDNSEAWFALARAYEESGQPDKAKDVLWWVVELEEKKPVRRWSCLGQGYSC